MPDPVNLLELKPRRNRQWELTEDQSVVILVPRFDRGVLARWLMPRLARPYIRVKLDPVGSFVWKRCDGETTVERIGEQLHREFEAACEPVYERIGAFIRKLQREDLIKI